MAEFTTKKYLDEAGLKKFWELNKQYIEEYLASRLFVGTIADYEADKDKLVEGALVILIDGVGGVSPDLPSAGGTTAKLGQAVLGTMLLGQA